MDIVVYTKFNGKREKAQSFARWTLYQTPVRNYDKESSNQRAIANNACLAWSVVAALYPKKCGTRILVSALYVGFKSTGIEFPMTIVIQRRENSGYMDTAA